MTLRSASPAHEDPRAVAIRRITIASEAIALVGKTRSHGEVLVAKSELAHAVGAARDLDISWQTIGDALGMRRGAAYQRFRRRPHVLSFAIDESPIDGVTVVAVRGELDALTVPRLAEAIGRCLAEVPMGLIVDLEEMTFMSSTGAGALVGAGNSARSSGKRFAVAAQNFTVSRTLNMLGVDELLELYPTVHAAMMGLHTTADGNPRALDDDGRQA